MFFSGAVEEEKEEKEKEEISGKRIVRVVEYVCNVTFVACDVNWNWIIQSAESSQDLISEKRCQFLQKFLNFVSARKCSSMSSLIEERSFGRNSTLHFSRYFFSEGNHL